MNLHCSLQEIIPSIESPFAGDKLNRESYAHILKSIVETYALDNCVLAINGEWGSGKTTFVKMWQQYMKNDGYRTIYFNAWETDYISDPFVAILGELKGIIKSDDHFNNVCAAVSSIALGVGTAVLNALVKQFTGISSEAIQGALNATKDVLQKEIDDYTEQKTTLAEFKKILGNYVADVDDNQPATVVFIIDELDRCNPHYAVKVLERIKHLFDIPNIFFVLPICKSQLECSIQGFYGSDKLDANNYLRRFITLEFELPKPENKTFCNYLYDYYCFDEFFNDTRTHRSKGENIETFKSSIIRLLDRTNIDLRTTDRLFAHCRLVAKSIHGNIASEMDVIFLLCYLKLLHIDVYGGIRNHEYNLQGLLSVIENIFSSGLMNPQCCDNLDYHGFTYTIAGLLVAYNLNGVHYYEKDVLPVSDESEMHLECSSFDKGFLHDALVYCNADHWSKHVPIKDLMDKIDLLQQLL